MVNIQENLCLPGLEEPEVTSFTKLSPRVELFCQEYVKHGVAYKAYMTAYQTPPGVDFIKTCNSARVKASNLMRKPAVLQRLNEITAEVKRDTCVAVAGYYRQVMEQDRSVYFHPDGAPKRVHEMGEDERRIVDLEAKFVDGGLRYIPVFGLRKDAATALAKISGMVADKLEVTGKNGGPLDVRSMSDDELLAIIQAGAVTQ